MKRAFSLFLGADPDRLHAAAHSHHPWPDVTYRAHQQAWEDAARLMDDKWDHVFGTVYPAARRRVADVLGLPDPDTLVFAPNTHELVVRIASTLPRPFEVLTTDAEFHSFSRQLARWEEEGIAKPTTVAAEPFDTFPDRLVAAYANQDLVFFSQVHFNSGYAMGDLAETVAAFPDRPLIVVDGYHGFMALPTDLGPISPRAFYLAGGYKYAMAGEGACFLHAPASAPARPVNTGWWAEFGTLADEQHGVPYSPKGGRFAGATTDPSGVYRLNAVLDWLEEEAVTVVDIHRHVSTLQQRLLDKLPTELTATLLPEAPAGDRGHFLTFRHPDADRIYASLQQRGVITDHRADRWRVGLGIYHDDDDIDLLAEAIRQVV